MPSDAVYKNCKELLNDRSFIQQMSDPNKFISQFTAIKEKITPILADYKTIYVLYNKNPDYTDYQQMFANIQNNVDNINSQLFTTLNDVQYDIDELNKKLVCLNYFITDEKEKNKKIKKHLGIVEEKKHASSELIYDYKNIYDEGYLRNWGLIISIIIVGIAVKNMYGNINGDMTSNVKNMGNNMYNMGNNMYNNAKDIGNRMGNR